MKIHNKFTGGNIKVAKQSENEVHLKNELRDTDGDWFYWAFCIEDAAGKEITFNFEKDRLGYYGPAVSYDLKEWHWLGTRNDELSFTYKFGDNENKVYFAHSMLYHPDRFYEFAKEKGIEIKMLCKGYKEKQTVPYFILGKGEISIILTARHHACESTGSYVLEGVLSELIENPIENTKVFCVPFVDFEGVIDGDQGKNRIPHDHNGDYPRDGSPSIYPECEKIREYTEINGCNYAFDFHSPWHLWGRNDKFFVVQNDHSKLERLKKFAELLKSEITEKSVNYSPEDDIAPDTEWNNSKSPNFSSYMTNRAENEIAFSMENAYFGTDGNIVSQEKFIEFGRCFAKTIKKYITTK